MENRTTKNECLKYPGFVFLHSTTGKVRYGDCISDVVYNIQLVIYIIIKKLIVNTSINA
jgi:hypothetical protein